MDSAQQSQFQNVGTIDSVQNELLSLRSILEQDAMVIEGLNVDKKQLEGINENLQTQKDIMFKDLQNALKESDAWQVINNNLKEKINNLTDAITIGTKQLITYKGDLRAKEELINILKNEKVQIIKETETIEEKVVKAIKSEKTIAEKVKSVLFTDIKDLFTLLRKKHGTPLSKPSN